jgi:hypothetical protein
LFNRYANGKSSRSAALLDLLGNEQMYQTSVSSILMTQASEFNAVMPYGIATFNRLGAFAGIQYRLPAGISLAVKHYNMREIRGQGTLQLKQLQQTKAHVLADLAKLSGITRAVKLRLGFEQQLISRNSNIQFEQVNLNLKRFSAGLEFEFVKKIDLMFGWLAQQSNGSDFVPERDAYSRVSFLERREFNNRQELLATGIRCRFEGNTYFTAFYQQQINKNPADQNPEYHINQFSLIYNMSF